MSARTAIQGLLLVFAAVLLLASLVGVLSQRDDTDSPDRRSGMSLHTDHLTGCQYLSKGSLLIPRMNADGTHRCIKP